MSNRGVNKVILVGNLGADPEIRYSAGGVAMVTLSLATSYNSQNKQTNEWKEHTEWHRLALYQRHAEVAGKYLRKGSKIYVEGRLQTRKWQDQNGMDRYTTEVVVFDMQMLGGRNEESSEESNAPTTSPPQDPPPQDNPPPRVYEEDDIPF